MLPPVVVAILVVNILVFGAWIAQGQSQFMMDNFLVSWDALEAGRYWTLLGSAFSHIYLVHFLLNMFVLVSFGPIVEYILGAQRFLIFYLSAAIFASFGHAAVSAFLLGKPDMPALGASGAISGLVILFSLMIPQARILLLGFIPMPVIVGALLFVGLDLVGLLAQVEGGGLPIGHGAHLSGALAGAITYMLLAHRLRYRDGDGRDFSDVQTWHDLIRRAGMRERL
jgi:membrane associated rhomboid family serine protease